MKIEVHDAEIKTDVAMSLDRFDRTRRERDD